MDYVGTVSRVLLSPGFPETCFNVSIIDDNIHEIAESFTISLSASSNPRVTLATENLNITILDGDGI